MLHTDISQRIVPHLLIIHLECSIYLYSFTLMKNDYQ